MEGVGAKRPLVANPLQGVKEMMMKRTTTTPISEQELWASQKEKGHEGPEQKGPYCQDTPHLVPIAGESYPQLIADNRDRWSHEWWEAIQQYKVGDKHAHKAEYKKEWSLQQRK